jgi:hypothetical protein
MGSRPMEKIMTIRRHCMLFLVNWMYHTLMLLQRSRVSRHCIKHIYPRLNSHTHHTALALISDFKSHFQRQLELLVE